jgi:hypothetical protein
MQAMLMFNALLVVRYIFVFHMKNPTAAQVTML